MKKTLFVVALMVLLSISSTSVLACTYENISIDSDGTVHGKYVPCQNPECPDFRKHFDAIKNTTYIEYDENGNIICDNEPATKKEQPQTKEEPQTKKEPQVNQPQPKLDPETIKNPSESVEVANAEQEVMDRINSTSFEPPQEEPKEKKPPIEKRVADGVLKIFGLK